MVLLRPCVVPPADGVRLKQADTTAVLEGKRLGCGTLYVAETQLLWFDESGMGFSLEYPSIGLHAISRDLSTYPEENLYVMVNSKLSEENEATMSENVEGEEDDVSSDEDEEGVISEIRFVPSNKEALASMFSAMCECQALHPDPEDEDSDEFDGDEYDVEEAENGQADGSTLYTSEEGLLALTPEGQATLDHLEGMLVQSYAEQLHMAGVRTDQPSVDFEDCMELDMSTTVEGQFDDADDDN